jgi:hypothetical protein
MLEILGQKFYNYLVKKDAIEVDGYKDTVRKNVDNEISNCGSWHR